MACSTNYTGTHNSSTIYTTNHVILCLVGNILIIQLSNLKRIYKSLPVYHLLQQAEADHWLKGIPYHHVGDSLWTSQLGQIYGLRIMIVFIVYN